MKLNLSIIILFLFIGSSKINAQKISTGIEGGIGITDLQEYPNETHESNIKPSFSLNYYVSYKLNKLLSISIEPGFITKSDIGNHTSINFQTPISLEYKIIDKIHLIAGPDFEYRLTKDYFYDINRFYIGIQTGIYYSLNDKIDLGIKGGKSFLGIFKDNTITLSDENGEFIENIKWNLYPYYTHLFVRYRF